MIGLIDLMKYDRLSILAGFTKNECQTVHWRITVDGMEKQNETVTLKVPVQGPFILRVQVIGTKLNAYMEQDAVSRAVDVRDFMQLIDLRRKEHIRSFEYRLLTQLSAGESLTLREATASLTTRAGQADLCAISSKKDPRFGFSMMKAKPVVLPNASEDPHILYDEEAQKWRVLACAWGTGQQKDDFPATLYESDHGPDPIPRHWRLDLWRAVPVPWVSLKWRTPGMRIRNRS